MARDPFHGMSPGPSGPYTNAAAVTPHDVTALEVPARALWIAGTGNLTYVPRDQVASVTITLIPAGTLLPVWAKQVLATGTTATGIVALW